jgi:hypothetical protein
MIDSASGTINVSDRTQLAQKTLAPKQSIFAPEKTFAHQNRAQNKAASHCLLTFLKTIKLAQ